MNGRCKDRGNRGVLESGCGALWHRVLWYGAAVSLCLVAFAPGALLAQNERVRDSKAPNGVTFAQAAPAKSSSVPIHRTYHLPENECSADFWDPYLQDDASALTQSPARVQPDLTFIVDPADTVQELPSEVIEPSQRVRQLDDEVIHPAQSLGDSVPPARPFVDAPGDHPDN
jgi:hypothetical protein